jgi:hypothetical protein
MYIHIVKDQRPAPRRPNPSSVLTLQARARTHTRTHTHTHTHEPVLSVTRTLDQVKGPFEGVLLESATTSAHKTTAGAIFFFDTASKFILKKKRATIPILIWCNNIFHMLFFIDYLNATAGAHYTYFILVFILLNVHGHLLDTFE